MAQITIPFLVIKHRRGRDLFYWQPQARLRKHGWKSVALGADESGAFDKARKLNRQVEDWEAGGARPLEVRRLNKAGTIPKALERFDAEHVAQLGAATQREYRSKLRTIAKWGGNLPVTAIDRKRIRVLRDSLMRAVPGRDGAPTVRHHMAHATLRVLRTFLQFCIDEGILPEGSRNPAENPGLEAPAARRQVWSRAARRAMYDAAIGAGMPSMALTIELAPIIVQRQGDMLRYTRSHWVEIPAHLMTDADHKLLAGLSANGRVMGIRGQQHKTGAWIEIPVVGEMRAHVEAELAKRKEAGVLSLFVDDTTGLPWDRKNGQTYFQRRFLEIKLGAAAAARDAGDDVLAAELEQLQFRDYRRTGVVVLGELGIADHLIAALTGHSLDETKKILEVYMPRNTAMAAAAIAMMVTRLPGSAERAEKESKA